MNMNTKRNLKKQDVVEVLSQLVLVEPEEFYLLSSGTLSDLVYRSFVREYQTVDTLEVAKRTTCPSLLVELAENSSRQTQSAVAGNPAIPNFLFEQLIRDAWGDAIVELSGNPSLPQSLQMTLAKMGAELVASQLTRRVDMTNEVREFYLKHTYSWGREALAQNTTLTEAEQVQLAIDISEDVRIAIAKNANACAEVLRILETDESWLVRINVAGNPYATTEQLARMAHDTSSEVRRAVAGNLNTDLETLRALVKNDQINVLSAILSQPKADAVLFEAMRRLEHNYRWRIDEMIAGHPNCPESMMVCLMEEAAPGAWAELARNEKTPAFIREKLFSYEREYVDMHLALNPTCSEEMLMALVQRQAGYSGTSIYEAALTSEACSEGVLAFILGKCTRDEAIRKRIAQHQNTSKVLLNRLARSKQPSIRFAALRNPNLYKK